MNLENVHTLCDTDVMVAKSDSETIQSRLKALRTRAGLSMARLARAAGYKQASSYQRYENESETFEFLPIPVGRRLAAVLVGKGKPPIELHEVMALCGVTMEGDKIVSVETAAIDDPSKRLRFSTAGQDESEWLGLREEDLAGLMTDLTEWIPEVDVRAGAGLGGEAILENFVGDAGDVASREMVAGQWQLPPSYLGHELGVRRHNARIVAVEGDSMSPTLFSGDRILVDISRKMPSPPGIFALWDGLGLVVKRVEYIPHSDPATVRIISDNPAHAPYERTVEEAHIIGRVIWVGRRL